MIGHEREMAYSEQVREEGGEQVVYLGALDHDDDLLKSAMAACDAFVIPSYLETPSLAALEAAGQNARIVITEIGSTREYFKAYAEYLNPNDLNSISSAINTALATPSRPELKAHVETKFVWTKTIERLVNIYDRVLAG